jgi:peptidoglycan/LPS O-acetylase OafA/YrhL
MGYHYRVPFFGAGYLGVDIFFVLSGYLITNIILKQINGDSFSILDFWRKRILRLFPAFFFFIFFVVFWNTNFN